MSSFHWLLRCDTKSCCLAGIKSDCNRQQRENRCSNNPTRFSEHHRVQAELCSHAHPLTVIYLMQRRATCFWGPLVPVPVPVPVWVPIQWFCSSVRKNTASEEESKGAEQRAPPAVHSGEALRPLLPAWGAVSPLA